MRRGRPQALEQVEHELARRGDVDLGHEHEELGTGERDRVDPAQSGVDRARHRDRIEHAQRDVGTGRLERDRGQTERSPVARHAVDLVLDVVAKRVEGEHLPAQARAR
jgi:hypothetical protein